jgi:hypothetical protein
MRSYVIELLPPLVQVSLLRLLCVGRYELYVSADVSVHALVAAVVLRAGRA